MPVSQAGDSALREGCHYVVLGVDLDLDVAVVVSQVVDSVNLSTGPSC